VGFWLQATPPQCIGTIPALRFASGDGKGPEPFMPITLVKGTASATPKTDTSGRLRSSVWIIGRLDRGPVGWGGELNQQGRPGGRETQDLLWVLPGICGCESEMKNRSLRRMGSISEDSLLFDGLPQFPSFAFTDPERDTVHVIKLQGVVRAAHAREAKVNLVSRSRVRSPLAFDEMGHLPMATVHAGRRHGA
jgi:hypothetical protein